MDIPDDILSERSPIPRTLLAVLIVALLGQSAARAQELGGWIELSAGRTDLQTVSVAGQNSETALLSYRQEYRVDFSWRFYPLMRMLVGGQFDQVDTRDAGDGPLPDVTRKRWRPYFNLRLGNPVYSAQFDLIRFENRTESNGASNSDIQDNYTALFGWKPFDYPSVRLRLQRTDSHDSSREVVNSLRDIVELTTEYRVKDKVRLFYRGAAQEFNDKLFDNILRRNAHNGEVSYGDSYWRGRAQLQTEYNVNYQKTKFETGGSGEIITQLTPSAGLSVNSDMPTDIALADNPILIDEDFVASAGINLGTPPPGGDDLPRNIGLDLGRAIPLDTLRVWVDRELPQLIASSFAWDIYTSSDNQIWQFQQTVAPAAFGPLEPRFELRIASVSARYVKAVTRPLQSTVPGSGAFPEIFVTQLEGFRRLEGSGTATETASTAHRLVSAFRLKLLENQPLFYDFSYAGRRFEDGPTAFTVSNGLTYRKQLNRVYTVSARVAREDTHDISTDLVSYPYSASLRATALPTVTHTLVFSGRFTELNDDAGRDTSVFLYNSAQLYRGARASLNLGKAVRKLENGQVADTTRVDFNSTLVPHRTVTLNLQYQWRAEDAAGGGLPSLDRTFSVGRVSVAYIPVAAIYLFGSYRVDQQSEAEDQTIRNYSFSWTPFPGGSLQLTFRYDDTFRSLLNQMFQIFSARARWNITRRWYIEVAWEDSQNESDLTRGERETLRGITRYLF